MNCTTMLSISSKQSKYIPFCLVCFPNFNSRLRISSYSLATNQSYLSRSAHILSQAHAQDTDFSELPLQWTSNCLGPRWRPNLSPNLRLPRESRAYDYRAPGRRHPKLSPRCFYSLLPLGRIHSNLSCLRILTHALSRLGEEWPIDDWQTSSPWRLQISKHRLLARHAFVYLVSRNRSEIIS